MCARSLPRAVCHAAHSSQGMSGKSISFIACGGFHTAAITDRGALYTWGEGYFGQLGQGDEADKKMPRRCCRPRL